MSLCGLLTWRPDLVVIGVCVIVSVCLSNVTGLGTGFSSSGACLVIAGEQEITLMISCRRVMKLCTHGKSPCPWCHGRIIWNTDDLSSVSPVNTSIFIFHHVWSWHYFRFAPFVLTVWTKPYPVPNFKWRHISNLLVIIRLGMMLSMMKGFQNMITIHWLRCEETSMSWYH